MATQDVHNRQRTTEGLASHNLRLMMELKQDLGPCRHMMLMVVHTVGMHRGRVLPEPRARHQWTWVTMLDFQSDKL